MKKKKIINIKAEVLREERCNIVLPDGSYIQLLHEGKVLLTEHIQESRVITGAVVFKNRNLVGGAFTSKR